MRHLLFIIAIMCSLSAQSQKIVIDKTDRDMRTIVTDSKICRDFTDREVFSFGLSYIATPDRQSWQLVTDITTNTSESVSAGDEVLIRTASGNVLHLTSDLDGISKLQSNKVGSTLITSYSISIVTQVTPEQLDELCGGILKIRACGIDKEYKKDKAGKFLTQCRKLITDRASKPNDF